MSDSERDANDAVDALGVRTDAAEARAVTAADAARALRETVGDLTGQLVTTSSQLATTTSQLQVTQRMVRTQRQVLAVMILLMLVIVGAGAYFGPKILSTTNAVRSTQITNRATSNQIADCLTPGRACYERSQENQRQLVTAIIDTNHNGVPDTQELLGRLPTR